MKKTIITIVIILAVLIFAATVFFCMEYGIAQDNATSTALNRARSSIFDASEKNISGHWTNNGLTRTYTFVPNANLKKVTITVSFSSVDNSIVYSETFSYEYLKKGEEYTIQFDVTQYKDSVSANVYLRGIKTLF